MSDRKLLGLLIAPALGYEVLGLLGRHDTITARLRRLRFSERVLVVCFLLWAAGHVLRAGRVACN